MASVLIVSVFAGKSILVSIVPTLFILFSKVKFLKVVIPEIPSS